MSTAYMIQGDTRTRLAEMAAAGIVVDLVLCSPAFLEQREYLPADHPDKALEMGREDTPGAFIDGLLDVTEACDQVLAPHGSIAIELGDTASGSGGSGGDYGEGGVREGQPRFDGTAAKARRVGDYPVRDDYPRPARDRLRKTPDGWPADKSLCMTPELYRVALAYGFNPLTGRTTRRWRVRNVIDWGRTNPSPGRDGDKFRRASSDLAIACRTDENGRRRYWDGDAVRVAASPNTNASVPRGVERMPNVSPKAGVDAHDHRDTLDRAIDSGTAPLLDWWATDEFDTDLWVVNSGGGYRGTTTTRRRERVPFERALACGATRTTSPDCPVHAGRPGQEPKAQRDARAAAHAPCTSRSNDHPDQELPIGSVPIDSSCEHSDSTLSPTSTPTVHECAPSATPHSTESHRTGPAPSTTSPDMPSGGTAPHTDGTPTSPSFAAHHLGTSGSSTSGQPYPTAPDLETVPSTAGIPSEPSACTCSFWRTITESTSHYATWPPKLIEPLIKAMCPERVCTICGEPSRRLVAAEPSPYTGGETERDRQGRGRIAEARNGERRITPVTGTTHAGVARRAQTVGWSDCGHDSWRAGIVLDPFGGSGTTGAVATGHGRDAILIDLDHRNLDLARDRVGPLFFHETTVTELAEALRPRAVDGSAA